MKQNITSINPKRLAILVAGCLVIFGLLSLNMSPFRAFSGAVWLNNGLHYISDSQIADRIEKINAPAEAKIVASINKSTQSCSSVESGLCEQSTGVYVDKELATPAAAYIPAVPDRKEVIGYCTLCNDGSFSPSCAVGRGACSWHGGVAAYNVARYRTIPGTPEIAAKPAVYSYSSKTYQDSPSYTEPATPSLNAIINFAN